MKRNIYVFQGIYYIVTGIWPLLSMRTFEAVSGKKVDKWLVRMVGLLTVNIGAAVLSNSQKNKYENIKQLAIGSAISFTIVDMYYSMKNRISKVYMLDAIVELIMITTMLIPRRNPMKNYNNAN